MCCLCVNFAYDTCVFVHVLFVGCTTCVLCVHVLEGVFMCVWCACGGGGGRVMCLVSYYWQYVVPCFLTRKLILMSIYVAESINNN